MKLMWKMPVEGIIKKAEEKISRHLNVVCVLDERNAEKEGRKILDALMDKKRKRHSFYWVIVGLPYEMLEEYPKLDDSVTCVSSLKCIDPDLLLMQKDILIVGEEHSAVALAAYRSRVPIVCITDMVTKLEKTNDGWQLPVSADPVAFVWDHMLAISKEIEDIKAVRLDKQGHPLEGYEKPLHFVSCVHFESAKNIVSIIKALGRLLVGGVRFHWTFIGVGEQYVLAQQMVAQYRLENYVTFVGQQRNPLPYIQQSDVFVQFACCEDRTNTSYEALVLGIPVLEINVDGSEDQIVSGGYGRPIESEKDTLATAIMEIASDPEKVQAMKNSLKQYRCDNELVEKRLVEMFADIS